MLRYEHATKNLRIVTSTTLIDQVKNIRITDGLIADIGSELTVHDGEDAHDFKGAYVSPGWMDMHVHLREPGYEHKGNHKARLCCRCFWWIYSSCLYAEYKSSHTLETWLSISSPKPKKLR